MLDADPNQRHSVPLKAGKDPAGRHCFKAPLKLAGARTIRVEEVKFSVLDGAGQKDPWSKILFRQAYGLGLIGMKMANRVAEVDMPLKTYADAIANIPQSAKFRKPEAPAF
jgi:hypothetical protein